MEGDPVRQCRPADELAHRLVRRGRLREIPRHLGRAAGGRHQAEEGTAIRSASSSATASATITAGCIRCCGPMAGARSSPTARPSSSIPTETARAVDFCRKFFQKTMLEDVLGWTDPSNNKAYLSGADLLHQQRREHPVGRPRSDFPDIAKVTRPVAQSEGAEGQRFHILAPWSHAIFNHTPDQQAAKDFLRWLMEPEAGRRLVCLGRQLLRAVPARLSTTRRCGTSSRATCRTAIRSRPRICRAGRRRSAAPQSESVAKYVVVDMFAKACAGKSTKEVIADANAQLKQIYKAGLSMSAHSAADAALRPPRRARAAEPARAGPSARACSAG